MGRSNCTRSLAYSVAICSARSQAPTLSAHRAMPMSSTTRCRRARWSPGGPDPAGGPPVELEPGDLAGDVHVSGRARRPGASRAKVGQAVGVAGHHVGEVGGVAVEHHGLGARRGPTSSPRRRAVAAIPSSGSRCPPSSRATVARTRAVGQAAAARRRRRGASPRAWPPPTTTATGRAAGSQPISSASTHDLEHPEPGAAVRLGHEHARPAQVGEPAPELVGERRGRRRASPARASAPTSSVEERARGGAQRLLLLAEREVHGRGP